MLKGGAVGLVVCFERLEQLVEGSDQVAVAQPVIDHDALFTSAHQVQIQQLGQMLRCRGGSQSQLIGNLPCTEFISVWGAFPIGRDKQFQNGASTRVTSSV